MASNSNIIQINERSASDVCQLIASRVRSRRLELNLTQSGLAARAGVNIETYRKFERTGEISLQNLVKLGKAFNMTNDFELFFSQKLYESLDDVLADNILRKRGKKQ